MKTSCGVVSIAEDKPNLQRLTVEVDEQGIPLLGCWGLLSALPSAQRGSQLVGVS